MNNDATIRYLSEELDRFRKKYLSEHKLVLKLTKKQNLALNKIEAACDAAWEANGERLN
jgi:hypothetical protein